MLGKPKQFFFLFTKIAKKIFKSITYTVLIKIYSYDAKDISLGPIGALKSIYFPFALIFLPTYLTKHCKNLMCCAWNNTPKELSEWTTYE